MTKTGNRFDGYSLWWCEITVEATEEYKYRRNLTVGCLSRTLEVATSLVRGRHPDATIHVVRKGERWQSELLVEDEGGDLRVIGPDGRAHGYGLDSDGHALTWCDLDADGWVVVLGGEPSCSECLDRWLGPRRG